MERIIIKSDHQKSILDVLLKKSPVATIYHDFKYLELINNVLGSRLHYLGIEKDNKLQIVLPLSIKTNKKYGNIINSSPFFGSYGGLIVNPELSLSEKKKLKLEMLKYYYKFAEKNSCVLGTITISPFENDQIFYYQNLKFKYLDARTIQIIDLPQLTQDYGNDLLGNYYTSSCRRTVKKGMKSQVEIKNTSEAGQLLEDFYSIYKQNMLQIGGQVKPLSFFEGAFEKFDENECFLRYASHNDKIVGGIFMFRFRDIIEYFQPALKHDYRNFGVNNFLIHQTILDLGPLGLKYWNFGGTWESQISLYRFKRGFGATDYSNYYFTTVFDDTHKLTSLKKEELLKEYEGFFVIPFNQLKTSPNN